jgi:hypothetical protein
MTDFDKNFEKYLNLYLDGRLDEAESEEFEKYLLDNPDKAGELEAYKTLDYTAKGEKLPDLPDGYWEGLNARINSRIAKVELEKSGWRKFKAFVRGEMFSFHRGMKYAAAVVSIALVILISHNIMDQTSPEEFAKDKMMIRPTEEPEMATESEDDTVFVDLHQLPPPDIEAEAGVPADMDIRKEKGPAPAKSETQPAKPVPDSAITSKIDQATPEPEPVEAEKKQELEKVKGGFDAEYGDQKSDVVTLSKGTDEIHLDAMQVPPIVEIVEPQREDSLIHIRGGRSGEIEVSATGDLAMEGLPVAREQTIPDSIGILKEDYILSTKMERAAADSYQVTVPMGDDVMTESSEPPQYKPLAELQSIPLGSTGIDTSGIRLPDTLLAKMSDTGEYRLGEEELDTTLYHSEAVRAKKSPSDLTLDDFPQLSRKEYTFTGRFYVDPRDIDIRIPEDEYNDFVPPKTTLDSLCDEGELLLLDYRVETSPQKKAEIFMDIVYKSYQISKISKRESDIKKCQKLLRMASQMGLMDFREFETYTDSLNMIRRDR